MKKFKILSFLFIFLILTFDTAFAYENIDERLKMEEQKLFKLVEEGNIKEQEIEKLKEEQDWLKEEIERVQKAMELTSNKIEEVNDEIGEIKIQLEEIKVEIELLIAQLKEREDEFRERIRSSQRINFFNYMEVVLTSGTFSEMINNLNHVKAVTKEDNKVIEEYMALREKLFKKREEQEKLLNDLNDKQIELEMILENLRLENENNKSDKDKKFGEYKKLINDYEEFNLKIEESKKLVKSLKELKVLIDKYGHINNDLVGPYKLHPIVEYKRLELHRLAAENGIKIKTTEGYRTIERENYLYEQGRTRPGQIVSYVRGGNSWHNYGLAFDIVIVDRNGNISWDTSIDTNDNGISDWKDVGELGKSLDMVWGGDWTKLVDMPHFQYTFGYTMSEYKSKIGR